MITFVKIVQALAFFLIFFSGVAYHRQLKLTKWKRKLTKGEMTMYLITSIAIPVYGLTSVILLSAT